MNHTPKQVQRQRAIRAVASYARNKGANIDEINAERVLFEIVESKPDLEISAWVNETYPKTGTGSANQARLFRQDWKRFVRSQL